MCYQEMCMCVWACMPWRVWGDVSMCVHIWVFSNRVWCMNAFFTRLPPNKELVLKFEKENRQSGMSVRGRWNVLQNIHVVPKTKGKWLLADWTRSSVGRIWCWMNDNISCRGSKNNVPRRQRSGDVRQVTRSRSSNRNPCSGAPILGVAGREGWARRTIASDIRIRTTSRRVHNVNRRGSSRARRTFAGDKITRTRCVHNIHERGSSRARRTFAGDKITRTRRVHNIHQRGSSTIPGTIHICYTGGRKRGNLGDRRINIISHLNTFTRVTNRRWQIRYRCGPGFEAGDTRGRQQEPRVRCKGLCRCQDSFDHFFHIVGTRRNGWWQVAGTNRG